MHKKTKRGQIPSQILTYFLILIVVSMILLFGYKAIKSTKEKEEQIILIQFKTELNNDIKSLSSDYGSVRVKEYELPSEFDELCFVDLTIANPGDIINHPKIKDSVESKAKQNMFLSRGDNFEAFYIQNLRLLGAPYACIQSETGDVQLEIMWKEDVDGVNAARLKTPPYKKHCENANNAVPTPLCGSALDFVYYDGYTAKCCELYSLCC